MLKKSRETWHEICILYIMLSIGSPVKNPAIQLHSEVLALRSVTQSVKQSELISILEGTRELNAILKLNLMEMPMARLICDFVNVRANTLPVNRKMDLDVLERHAKRLDDVILKLSRDLCTRLERATDEEKINMSKDELFSGQCRERLRKDICEALNQDTVTFSVSSIGHEQTGFSCGGSEIVLSELDQPGWCSKSVLTYINDELSKRESASVVREGIEERKVEPDDSWALHAIMLKL